MTRSFQHPQVGFLTASRYGNRLGGAEKHFFGMLLTIQHMLLAHFRRNRGRIVDFLLEKFLLQLALETILILIRQVLAGGFFVFDNFDRGVRQTVALAPFDHSARHAIVVIIDIIITNCPRAAVLIILHLIVTVGRWTDRFRCPHHLRASAGAGGFNERTWLETSGRCASAKTVRAVDHLSFCVQQHSGAAAAISLQRVCIGSIHEVVVVQGRQLVKGHVFHIPDLATEDSLQVPVHQVIRIDVPFLCRVLFVVVVHVCQSYVFVQRFISGIVWLFLAGAFISPGGEVR
ncbi:hypothetical protein D910_04559 [Dendroctonus ponderosae]|uniref:Uncharacterized protein n=1 Tax=Dendroctonus ponderosae TaxID=77166 RepID=U4TZU7_DENPD|nr:hypothetical protein D910_04559 [Dendroctonus ponderosae]